MRLTRDFKRVAFTSDSEERFIEVLNKALTPSYTSGSFLRS